MTELAAIIDRQLGNDQTDQVTEARAALLKTVNADSLGAMIGAALEHRRQGRLDRAIGLITQANRQQLDAIEDVQQMVNDLSGKPNPPVVFAKYRQIQPFEMGIEHGDDVLSLLAGAEAMVTGSASDLRARLHQLEDDKRAEAERLEFFERRYADGSEDATIEEARAALQALGEELIALKASLLSPVLSKVAEFLPATKQTVAGTRHHLSRSLYLLIASPTRTRHARDVDVDA